MNLKKNSLVHDAVPSLFDKPNPRPSLDCSNPSTSSFHTCNASVGEQMPLPASETVSQPGPSLVTEGDRLRTNISNITNDYSAALLICKDERIKKKDIQIRNLKKKVKRLETKVASFNNNYSDLKIFSSGMKPEAKAIIASQLKNCQREKHGKRYSQEMRSMAIQHYFHSPRGYKLLRNFLDFPHPSTVQTWLSDLNIQAGFSSVIFELLKNTASKMASMDRVVTLILDEMSIKSAIIYLSNKDEMFGFHQINDKTTSDVATQAMVLMIRSMTKNWKQPIGFFLCHSSYPADDLKMLILRAIQRVHTTGLTVKLVVCDQGPGNRRAISSLGVSVDTPYFCLPESNEKIYFMYDVPHLLKSIRNNLKKHDIFFNGGIAKWVHLVQLYDAEQSMQVKSVPKLTRRHVQLPAFSSMRVNLAAQVFSHSVASSLSLYVNLGSNKISSNATQTAQFLSAMDRIFDIFNSSSMCSTKIFKRPVAESTKHWDELNRAELFLKSMRVDGLKTAPPCILGWILNINSLKLLWDDLHKNYNFSFLMTRRLNQDALENFFSVIRSKGGHGQNPDPRQFLSAYKSSLITLFMKSGGAGNCENDAASLLLNHQSFTDHLNNNTPLSNEDNAAGNETTTPDQSTPLPTVSSDIELNLIDIEENVVCYIAGYVCKRIIHCKNLVVNYEPKLDSHRKFLTYLKNYANESDFGGLCVPSDSVITSILQVEHIFKSNIKLLLTGKNIAAKLFSKCADVPVFCCITCFNEIIMKYLSIRLYHEAKLITRNLLCKPKFTYKINPKLKILKNQ